MRHYLCIVVQGREEGSPRLYVEPIVLPCQSETRRLDSLPPAVPDFFYSRYPFISLHRDFTFLILIVQEKRGVFKSFFEFFCLLIYTTRKVATIFYSSQIHIKY